MRLLPVTTAVAEIILGIIVERLLSDQDESVTSTSLLDPPLVTATKHPDSVGIHRIVPTHIVRNHEVETDQVPNLVEIHTMEIFYLRKTNTVTGIAAARTPTVRKTHIGPRHREALPLVLEAPTAAGGSETLPLLLRTLFRDRKEEASSLRANFMLQRRLEDTIRNPTNT